MKKGEMTAQAGRTIGAVDIGGTKIAVGLVDERGEVIRSHECATQQERGFEDAVDRIATMLLECAGSAGVRIDGIGIGCTGPVNPFTGEIGDVQFLKTWNGGNLIEALEKRFGVRVSLENDADAAALGEAFWGSGRGMSQVLFVTVGTGIGVGVVLNGRLYRGVDGAHPEIGHQVIDASGPECYCGARGCWEVLAAGPAMLAWMRQQGGAADVSGKAIFSMASGGDQLAQRVVDREAHYLGLGLANLVNIFCPEAIVLGGGVMQSAALLLDGIRSEIRMNCTQVPAERTQIRMASLGIHSAILGAACGWHHRFGKKENAA